MSRKRNWGYLFLFVGLFLAVAFKQHAVTKERSQVIVSALFEWKEKGKPVFVYEVRKRDVPRYTKATVWQVAPHDFVGYVTEEVKEKISVGQEMFFCVDKSRFQGTISKIAEEISLDTGMYQVQVSFKETFDLKGWLVALAHTDTLRGVICIPNEVIDRDKDALYMWKVVDSKAQRQKIAIGQRDGYGAVVTEGIKEGDVIVVKGFSGLNEGEKVKILKSVTAEEIDND
jgi:hypothetical protein